MLVADGSTVGTSGSGFNLDSLSLGPESELLFAQDVLEMRADTLVLLYQSQISSQSVQKDFTIHSNTFTIYDLAGVSVDEGGNTDGNGAGDSTKGASYGGQGGGADAVDPFGSVIEPELFGSGCGSNRGGGKIRINVADDFFLYGKVSANGASGASGVGGASGGSVWIEANFFAGHGDVEAKGGAGPEVAGGGGGRVAVYAPGYEFIGATTITGGESSSDVTTGAAGTEFRSFTASGTVNKLIRVDNDGQIAQAFTGLTDGLDNVVKLEVLGNAVVKMTSDTQTSFQLQTVRGDFTGLLYVLDGQTLQLATTAGIRSPYALPLKVHVEEGAICHFSPNLMLKDPVEGGDRNIPNMYMAGKMINVNHLYVGELGQVTFEVTAFTELSSIVTSPGTIKYTSLNVINSGELTLAPDTDEMFTVEADTEIKVHFGGVVYGRNIRFVAAEVSIAYLGIVDVEGQGHASETGDAAGVSATIGGGGSYGGAGGLDTSGLFAGSLYEANMFGSGGGNGGSDVGGAGGGRVTFEVSDTMTLDGIVKASGAAGTGAAGGGAGGSIFLQAPVLMGATGSLQVRGGDAENGGAGGGGRIVVDVEETFTFIGTYEVSGGVSEAGHCGGGGTAFQTTYISGIPITRFYTDNSAMSDECVDTTETYFAEGDNANEAFTQFYVGRASTLLLFGNDVLVETSDLDCDSATANIKLPDNTIFVANAGSDVSTISCSFQIQTEGQLRMPRVVTLTGSNNEFGGYLVGVNTMVIAPRQTASFKNVTRTAQLTADDELEDVSAPGAYKFTNFIIKDYATCTFEGSDQSLRINNLELQFSSTLFGEKEVRIISTSIQINEGATFNLVGGGYGAGAGPGAGQDGSSAPTGAGYGGKGGQYTSDQESSDARGEWYGLVRDPVDMGSGGGGSEGGAGGAFLYLRVYETLSLEGTH